MPLRYTLRQLEYFVAVGEAGSIARAAERVSVSSPSISAAIAALEAEFGVQLFVRRHAQGLSLTPGGRRLFQEAQRLLEQGRALHDVAGDVASAAGGPLSLGCFVTLAPFLLPALRRSFAALCPEARVGQVEADQARLFELLRRAEIDVALLYDMEIPAEIAFRPLAALSPYVLLPAGHRLAARESVALDDLAGEPMVLLDLPISREYFLGLTLAHGFRPLIAERTAELSVLRSLVGRGFGYALLNIRSPSREAPDGSALAAVALEGRFAPLRLGLGTMRGARKTRVLRLFEAHAAAEIARGGVPGL
ncbi:MAG: LysR substrate-binding domain-containing protein [Pikeienuella sp.]|uniref:LysR substrate-binding domain-containing protein n=1 Tax=Pikeienuella sp. TaxID=2831957 RepID=UPI00391DE5AA